MISLADLDFVEYKPGGELITISGWPGIGKSTFGLFFNMDLDRTWVIDTEPVKTTMDTLHKYGHKKVWRASCWEDIVVLSEEFIRQAGEEKATLIIDSASCLVSWIRDKYSNRKGGKAVTPREFKEVWAEFRHWFWKIINTSGQDLILIHNVRPNYTEEEKDDDGKVIKYGKKDGTYDPHEWSNIQVYEHYGFALERGLVLPRSKERIFTDKVFCSIRKARYCHEGLKRFLVPLQYEVSEGEVKNIPHNLYTRECVTNQLMGPYQGTLIDNLAELYQFGPRSFCEEIDERHKSLMDWNAKKKKWAK